ncbi:hypothetical protein IBX81_05505 [Neisseria gonorrhoeae]|nr:hypothetical protein IBX81_05505 [Neisseria gonorrhoeae]
MEEPRDLVLFLKEKIGSAAIAKKLGLSNAFINKIGNGERIKLHYQIVDCLRSLY